MAEEPNVVQPEVEPEKKPEVEALAQQMGWDPDYDGDDRKDAKTFILDGVKINREKFRKYDRSLKSLQSEVSEAKRANQDFAKFAEEERERAVKSARAELKREIKDAAESGDAEKAEKLLGQMTELEDSYRRTPAKQPPQQPPVPTDMVEFLEEQKDWMEKSEPATLFFAHKAQQMAKYHPNDHMTALNETLKEVKKEFPELFKSGRKAPRMHNDETAGGVSKPSSGNGKVRWEDLPSEAKEACKRMEKQIPNFTKERFLKSFDLDEYSALKRKQERI
uniref:Uncharacterized protein n=1 Tax=viral metagenome TaxID=1070528 RepID=A0A6M3LFR3_9ZZZZ